MCGIASIFAYHYAAPPVDRKELQTIRDHMINRGPDGKGEWYSANNRIGLGHRRLSIIDLTESAAQPMTSQDAKHVISFNGEVYNYKELRKELEHKKYKFRTHSDTEVLLHLYAEKGEEMVHDLRGMFAFAIWDENKQALFLARDPYGIKPLYYADDGWTVRVASQVKAILAGGKVSREPEPAGIVGFYLLGSVPEPWTIYQDIHAVPAGSTMWVTNTGPTEPIKYFSIAKVWQQAGANKGSTNDIQQQIREALLDSVRDHMVADVQVGAFLSAGIDSTSLVGLMSELSPDKRKLKTITLAFEEYKGSENDEAPLAEEAAQLYGTDHTTRYVTEQEFLSDLPAIMEAMDQPTIDGINTWYVAKAARELELKVAISGLGGDELFGGYPSFRDVPRWVKAMWLPSRVPLLGGAVRRLLGHAVKHASLSPKISGMVKYGGYWGGAWYLRRGLFMPWELEKFMAPDIVRQGLQRLRFEHLINRELYPDPGCAFAKVSTLESSLYMRNQLLRDADWAGMAHSLEIRVPLVDCKLQKEIASLLLKENETNMKHLLASCPEKVMPSSISKRAKTGFFTPVSQWQKKLRRSDVEQKQSHSASWAREWAVHVNTGFDLP